MKSKKPPPISEVVVNSRDFQKLRLDRPYLGETFERYWETPLADYAPNLYSKTPRKLEAELQQALLDEWRSMGLSAETASAALRRLESGPVLQTSHHITPTHGPSFLAMDIISLSGLKDDEFYLVGANSGVAFSNSAWSGALSYEELSLDRLLKAGSPAFRQAARAGSERNKHGASESRVSLIPSRQRDQIVNGAQIRSFQTELFKQFTPDLRRLLSPARQGVPYSHWAAITAARIQTKILRRPNILIFDINRAVARYLAEVLSFVPGHPVERILFHAPTRRDVDEIFQRPPMFLSSVSGKKSSKVDVLFWEGRGLRSLKSGFHPYDKEGLVNALKEGSLCPGVFLLFFALRFLNGIRCLGSFNQIEYLEKFRQKWGRVDVGRPMDLDPDYSLMLTAGRIPVEPRPIMPLDLALNGRQVDLGSFSRWKMKRFWTPVVAQLTK